MPVCEKCLFIFRQKAIASGKENIWDPALRILGYPAGRISGKISIRSPGASLVRATSTGTYFTVFILLSEMEQNCNPFIGILEMHF